MRRVVGRALGILILLVSFALLLVSMTSYAPLRPAPQEEGTGLSLGVVLRASNDTGLITVRVRILNLKPYFELPVADTVVSLYIPQTNLNGSLKAFTGKDGSVSFRVSPGKYIVGTSYLGMAGNATVEVSSKGWVLVDMNFMRKTARSFTLQIHDVDGTGIIAPESSILAHFYTDAEEPMVAELLRAKTLSLDALRSRDRISLFWIKDYEKDGDRFWSTLAPLWPLALKEINPSSDLSLALYWLDIEVSKLY